jgi:hypothetical protein
VRRIIRDDPDWMLAQRQLILAAARLNKPLGR